MSLSKHDHVNMAINKVYLQQYILYEFQQERHAPEACSKFSKSFW